MASRTSTYTGMLSSCGFWIVPSRPRQAMENRAAKYVARRNDVLVRAIMRIWKAHERGQLLTRVRAMRVLKLAWTQWRRRMEEQREREGRSVSLHLICNPSLISIPELAQLFRTRSTSLQGASALKRWRGVYQSHQNAQSFAVHYDRERLQYQMMLTWRLQLRAHLRKAKQAKIARKYLLLRRCFHVWTAKVEEKRREKKLREFQMRKAKKVFEGEYYSRPRNVRHVLNNFRVAR